MILASPGGAVRHAGRAAPEFLFHAFPVVVDEVRLVRKLDRREILLVQLEIIVLDDVIEIKHVGRDRVQFVIGERLRVAEGHRAPDIVHHGRGVGPIRPDRLDRIVAGQCAGAPHQDRPASRTFTEFAMTSRATLHIERFALLDRPLAGREPVTIRTDVDVPACDFFRRCRAPDSERLRRAVRRGGRRGRVGFLSRNYLCCARTEAGSNGRCEHEALRHLDILHLAVAAEMPCLNAIVVINRAHAAVPAQFRLGRLDIPGFVHGA